MSKPNDDEREQILKEIDKHQTEINRILIEISSSQSFGNKAELYQKILKLDNTNEDYVVNYLYCYHKILKTDDIDEINTFKRELNKYEICISDKKYDLYFSQYPRKNARNKILYFLELIRDSPITDVDEKAKFISKIMILLHNIYKVGFRNKKKITWENEELYLNHLYISLIYSICYLIIYYNKVQMTKSITDNQEFIEIKKKIENSNDNAEKYILNILLTNFLLFRSNYFDYLEHIQKFLKDVDIKFQERFGNLELATDRDKSLFEDYINFLCSFKFNNRNYNDFWKETFVSLKLEEKKKIINLNYDSYELKFELLQNGEQLKIYSSPKDNYIIVVDKYNLANFIYDAKVLMDASNIQWKLNRYMKPNFYKEELFVCKARNIWKDLLINIFQSRAYNEVRKSLFTESQIDFFSIDEIIKNIIDNIKFFIYDTIFIGATNNYTDTIYEYGNINLEIQDINVALLIFYGFHVIINLHEIGGHLNIKYQYFFSLKEIFHSPEISEEMRKNYSSYGQTKERESGETIEIKLFGEVKQNLTIREALFILNKDNYSLNPIDFKNNFLSCNDKKISDLTNDSLKNFLNKLGIIVDKLDEEDKTNYNFPLKRRTNGFTYSDNKSRHPISFYHNIPDLMEKYFKNYHPIKYDNQDEI